MKTPGLFIILSMLSLAGYGQCKIVKTQADKFNKKEYREASISVGSVKLFKGGVKWLLTFSQEGGKTTLKASIAMEGEFNQVFDERTKFFFLLGNDQVIELENSVPAKPVTKAIVSSGVAIIFSTYTLTLPISLENMRLMATSNVAEVKVEVPDQNIKSPDISKKEGQQINEIIKCLLETAG